MNTWQHPLSNKFVSYQISRCFLSFPQSDLLIIITLNSKKKKRKWFYILFFDVDSILKGGEKGTDCALNKWKLMTCQMRANTIWKMYLLGKLPHYIEIWMESNETNFHYLHVFLFQLLLDMNHFPYIRLTPKVCVFCLWLGTALAIVSI